ncbi:MAG: hypothetical protein JWR61_5186 [Ferruginibacter sp.]|jgi:hypothetical protein|nr:hypothetical protein [Ferruginibacter sp.]
MAVWCKRSSEEKLALGKGRIVELAALMKYNKYINNNDAPMLQYR